MREEKAQQYELIKEYERKHLQHMIMRDPYKSKISEDSLRGTFMETSKRLKRKRVTDGFNDTDLAGPRYDAIQEEKDGRQEMVDIEIDDDFDKEIESDYD